MEFGFQGGGGGASVPYVESVTGLNTDNTDPQNPIVEISVDGSTITGLGTPASPLVSNGVTNVTGTSPIVSSGGTTPAISIPAASNVVNGYLSSADWTTFKAKQDAITLTTTGSSGAATLIGATLNIPNYAGATSGIWGISNSLGVYTYYATLTLAMAAATSGQVIEMFADVVETGAVTVTLKNGVNINGNGHTYTLSNSGVLNALRDNAVAVSCEIYNIKIIRTLGTTPSNIENMCLSITSTTSEIKCNGAFFKNTNGTAIRTDGSIWGASAISTSGSLGTIFSTGNIYDGYFESTNVNAIYANSGNIINCKGIANTSGVGIYVQNVTANVYNSYGKSSSGTGLDSGGGKMFNSIGVSTTGYGIGAASGSELTQCTGISTSGFGLNGNGYLAYQCRFISSSAYGAGGGNGAEHYDCSHESTSNVAVFGYVGLKLYRGLAYSKWNNAGGHAFQQWSAGNSSVLNNVFLRVTNASANCINSGGAAATIGYSQNAYLGATTPISSFVTQTLINTEDNQGNIKL